MSEENWFNIVLYRPQIPANTGNIGRLCVGLNIRLHLIEPLGFKLTEKNVKRAGLDYWPFLELVRYDSLESFFTKNKEANFYFSSTKATAIYTEIKYQQGDFVIFGQETKGLPEIFHTKFKDKGILIPMPGKVRSINLANTCAIVAYEAYRQLF